MTDLRSSKPVLVVGATGYIGGRLVPRLLEAGYSVRVLARSPRKLLARPWGRHPELEVVQGDVLEGETLPGLLRGCGPAFYLVHSMKSAAGDFASADRAAAGNMATAATAAGLERIIYLSGLGEEEQEELSHHLRSRHEVGEVLRSGSVPVTELRAAMIIGSGSASFEILRYLVDRLPVMVTPRWVHTPCQPIAVRNVLGYLVGCLEAPATAGEILDIGGPEVVTYRRLMEIYAEEAGLRRRLIVPVPVLTPRLSSYWIHLVTPVPASLARPLAEGLRNRVVCRDRRILERIPLELFDCRRAIRLALERIRQEQVESSWTDAGEIPPAEWSVEGDPAWAGGTVFTDQRKIELEGAPETVWPAVAGIGGRTGWYYADWLWRLRGLMDRLVGGVGLGRGRRSAGELHPGDALDFWRVVDVDRPRRLLLLAEMKVPGEALLELNLSPLEGEGSELVQSARFLPRGLAGILYWYAVTPLHGLVFNGMLRGIATASGSKIRRGPERLPADSAAG